MRIFRTSSRDHQEILIRLPDKSIAVLLIGCSKTLPSPILRLERVSEEASVFASTVDFSAGDGKDAWIFDIDETLLSNLPYYIDHGFGVEVFDHSEFDKWVERGVAPAIAPSLKLYQRVIDLGYRVFLLAGRKESERVVTVENLINAGFQNWDKLILTVFILFSLLKMNSSYTR
ncbi:hypothetical protein IGI04_032018 [Brassica rapa subsp. trilocularis]|uniref:Uncharacterized protein n=1 Tax=Brassica rapa subsp. trilocularis TaxID=1813537 RepID=A0ABQ7LVZ5_BRACM|nr:hypothetical protein IGI04_032018 [Brassica rapa subsp. trilocularis]